MEKDWDKSVDTEVSNKETQEAKANPENNIDYAKAHKEAQDELSKKGEALIEANLKLAEINPKSILDMDRKMQNKVVKKLYWYENIEELKLIQGDEFYKESSDEDEDDDDNKLSSLEKEVKILKYQREKGALEWALEKFKTAHPWLVKDDTALEKIKTELEYISESLPAEDRVKRAAKIALWNTISDTDAAYLAMQDVSMWGTSSSQKTEEKAKENDDVNDIFSWVLKAKKQKEEYLKKMR